MKDRKTAVTVTFVILKILTLLLVIAALISLGKSAYSFGYKVFAEETVSDPPGKKVAVTIKDGVSASELGDLLEKKGLIKDSKIFWIQMKLSKYKDKLKAGTYILNTSQTSEEMLRTMSGEEESESETE